MIRGWHLWVFGVAMVPLAGCGDTRVGGVGESVVDSAGVRIITLPDDPGGAGRAFVLDANWPTERLSFGELVDLDVTPSGHVVLLDRMEGQVTVLSPEGAVEGRFGRIGEGPGEMSPFGLFNLVATDSTILVPDIQLQRITEFSLEGSVLGTRTVPGTDAAGGAYAIDWRAYAEGGVVARVLSADEDLVVRLQEAGFDTLYSEPVPSREGNLVLGPSLIWDADGEGRIAVGLSDVREVRLWDPSSGRFEWITRHGELQHEITEGDIEHLERLVLEEVRAGGLPSPQQEAILASMRFASNAPTITAVHAAPRGRYWVQRALPVGSMGREALRLGSTGGVGSSEWEVLGADGLIEEVVLLPEGFRPIRFVGQWIYGIVEDELGVQAVARVEVIP